MYALIVATLLLAATWIGLRFFEQYQLYHPDADVRQDPSTARLAFEEIIFTTESGGRLHGWWIPHPSPRASVVFCHGNAGNIAGRIDVARSLHERGLQVFLFDYRGYGLSTGWPSERRMYEDACAAFEVVRSKHGDMEQPPVFAFGASLGGAVATELALRKPVLGLLIEGAFTSVPDVGERLYPWLPVRWMTANRYDTAIRIESVRVPVLIAHSRDDEVIPFSMGQELFRRARDPKTWVELRGPHGEAGWMHDISFAHALDVFINRSTTAQ